MSVDHVYAFVARKAQVQVTLEQNQTLFVSEIYKISKTYTKNIQHESQSKSKNNPIELDEKKADDEEDSPPVVEIII